MKKKKLRVLSLNKKSISNLVEKYIISGNIAGGCEPPISGGSVERACAYGQIQSKYCTLSACD